LPKSRSCINIYHPLSCGWKMMMEYPFFSIFKKSFLVHLFLLFYPVKYLSAPSLSWGIFSILSASVFFTILYDWHLIISFVHRRESLFSSRWMGEFLGADWQSRIYRGCRSSRKFQWLIPWSLGSGHLIVDRL